MPEGAVMAEVEGANHLRLHAAKQRPHEGHAVAEAIASALGAISRRISPEAAPKLPLSPDCAWSESGSHRWPELRYSVLYLLPAGPIGSELSNDYARKSVMGVYSGPQRLPSRL